MATALNLADYADVAVETWTVGLAAGNGATNFFTPGAANGGRTVKIGRLRIASFVVSGTVQPLAVGAGDLLITGLPDAGSQTGYLDWTPVPSASVGGGDEAGLQPVADTDGVLRLQTHSSDPLDGGFFGANDLPTGAVHFAGGLIYLADAA